METTQIINKQIEQINMGWGFIFQITDNKSVIMNMLLNFFFNVC